MADILTNEEKQDEILTVQEPSLQGYGEQSYIGTAGGKPQASAVAKTVIYTNTTAVTAVSTTSYDLATFTIPAGTLLAGSILRINMALTNIDWDAASSAILSLFIGNGVNVTIGTFLKNASASNAGGWAEFIVSAITNKSGVMNGHGFTSENGVNSTALKQSYNMPTLAYATYVEDFTKDTTAILRVTYGASSVNNTVTMSYIIAERLA